MKNRMTLPLLVLSVLATGRILGAAPPTLVNYQGVLRSSADAPEIDGTVHVAPAGNLKPGEFAKVRVTRADTHDLWAEVI